MLLSLQDVVNFANATLLNPWVASIATGVLAWRSKYASGPVTKDALLALLHQDTLRSILRTDKAVQASLAFFLVGFITRFNAFRSRRALNPGGKVLWTPSGEIALVTGGKELSIPSICPLSRGGCCWLRRSCNFRIGRHRRGDCQAHVGQGSAGGRRRCPPSAVYAAYVFCLLLFCLLILTDCPVAQRKMGHRFPTTNAILQTSVATRP